MRSSFRYRSRSAAVAGIAALAAAAAGLAAPAAGATSHAAATHQKAALATSVTKPGRTGGAITLIRNASFSGNITAARMATDKSGATYIAWISSNDNDSDPDRVIHLCVIPANDHACMNGNQTVTPSVTAGALQLLVTPAGVATVLWSGNVGDGTEIFEATATRTGDISDEKEVSAAPPNGGILDAAFAPDGSIWTIAGNDDGVIDLRKGLTAAAITVKNPYAGSWPSYGSLAFSHNTPILVFTKVGTISTPPSYTSNPGPKATYKTVPNTWDYGANVGLTTTSSGVRLITGDATSSGYASAISRWTGKGFSKAHELGAGFDPDSQDTSTDASGRLIDVGHQVGTATSGEYVEVVNMADTIHPSVFKFGIGPRNTIPGSDEPAATASPRGRGWVTWAVEASDGDTLMAAPFELAGLHTTKTAHGSHGRVTVTGPASCLPAVGISVAVAGHPARGWKVYARTLTLNGKKVGSILNGAALSAAKTYTLAGTVTFAKGHSRTKVKDALKFRACPNPN